MATSKSKSKSVAIIGGGITGAIAARTLLAKHENNESSDSNNNDFLTIHVYDQGRRGVGGRTSSRSATAAADDADAAAAADDGNSNHKNNYNASTMRWDHGCQFFRADTPRFQEMMHEWTAKDFVREWTGNFVKSGESLSSDKEFFGLPSTPPFYVAVDGMQSLTQHILDDAAIKKKRSSSSSTTTTSNLEVFTGTRVANLERDPRSQRWKLHGTSGTAAYHDTSEKIVRQLRKQQNDNGTPTAQQQQLSGSSEISGYDAVILTDVSSSFGKWHRASAGVPEEFASAVRERVGARVPLFAAMIAFDEKTNIPFDAASFDDSVVWFASRTNSKPGMERMERECWTIVSTPEYAMEKIEETPMQDERTGEFIPQSPDYLTTVPGPDLSNAFQRLVCEKRNEDGENASDADGPLPEVVHMDAQRWGSAMPRHRHLDHASPTQKVISGVPYDSGRFPLAPTKVEERCGGGSGGNGGDDTIIQTQSSFLVDDSLMLLQAGDMVSSYTPGLEGAALSGCDAAEYLHDRLFNVASS